MTNTHVARRTRGHRSARRLLGLLVSVGASVPLALGVALGAAAPASAHDALESAAPAADATVTESLTSVALGFSDDLLALAGGTNSFAIQVLDGGDRHYESGCVTVNGPTASTEVAPGPAGTYEVLWQVVSSDGHPTSGSYTFDYAPSEPGRQSDQDAPPLCGAAWAGSVASAPTPAESAASGEAAEAPAPDAGAAATSETPAPGDDVDSEAAGSGVPLWAIVLGGIAGLGLIAAVIALTMRRTRRFPGENDPTS